jgi:hypothetical protein
VRRTFLIAHFVAASTAIAAPTAHAQATLTLLDYRTTVPAGWAARAPASTMRLAEYNLLPDPQGTAEVVVYFFGQGQGGNVDANLARWKDQFSTSDGSPVTVRVTRETSGPFPLTFAEYRGNYRRGIGTGSADSVRTGQTLIAGIVETPRGTLFIQLFGNSARVAQEKAAFLGFVRDLH